MNSFLIISLYKERELSAVATCMDYIIMYIVHIKNIQSLLLSRYSNLQFSKLTSVEKSKNTFYNVLGLISMACM